MRHIFLGALTVGLVFSGGCGTQGEPAADSPAAAPPRAAVRLTLLVVDDSEMAAAAKLLRGEWAERSGGELVVEETTLADLENVESLAADLVIYPSRQVGTFVTRGWLRPVRDSVLHGDSFALDDILPLVQNQAMRYGGQVYGISLGEAPLVVAWTGKSDATADTWMRLDERMPPAGNSRRLTMELIARAASYVDSRNRAELLFDPETLAPRLESPPVVRALEEMVARSKREADAVRRSRITWPTSTELASDKSWQFAALPRAGEAFDVLREDWQPRPTAEPLTVLGFAGRSVSVASSSRNATSAFKLLGWLTSGDAAIQLSSRSHATVWFRSSQVSRAERWLDGRGEDGAATLITRMLSAEDCFFLPRIPGIDQYLDALGEAVDQAVRGELSPRETLAAAAKKWDEISDRLGRDAQELAYRRHLGLVTIGE